MATVQIRTRARGFLINANTGEEITGANVDAQWEENVNTITSGSYDIDFSAYDDQDIHMVDNKLRIKAEVYERSIPSGYVFLKWELVATNRYGDTNTYSSDSNPSHANGSSNGWALESFIGDSTTSGRRATLDFYLYITRIPGPEPITLSYDANGGEGAPQSEESGTGIFTISDAVPVFATYTFLGWSLDQQATSPEYHAGDSITITESATLYAVWQGYTPTPEPTTKSGYLLRGSSSPYLTYKASSGHLAYHP